MLQTESWIGAEFKPFDVEAPAPMPTGGRRHPMQSLIERIRSVFLEMGCSEIEGDYVQSAGWIMDSLFIPQSHPARTMQDTFYLNQPRKVEVDEEYLDLWARVHEHGHDTGSKGWGGSFDKEESQRALLTTHPPGNPGRHSADNPPHSVPSLRNREGVQAGDHRQNSYAGVPPNRGNNPRARCQPTNANFDLEDLLLKDGISRCQSQTCVLPLH